MHLSGLLYTGGETVIRAIPCNLVLSRVCDSCVPQHQIQIYSACGGITQAPALYPNMDHSHFMLLPLYYLTNTAVIPLNDPLDPPLLHNKFCFTGHVRPRLERNK